ncbi:MAG: vitamin B12-dependent ribonucleotide reductase [Thermoplasmata archaeon]
MERFENRSAEIGSWSAPELTANAERVLERRYLNRDEKGVSVETPKELFLRVAFNIAEAERLHDKDANVDAMARDFYDMIMKLEFLPNSPTLMNAGNDLQQLSACFVLPVDDSIEGIFDALKWQAKIHQSGGGTGFSFDRLRPEGDFVRSTMGVASGPVSFMKIFDEATQQVKQGGKRRGANMGILRVDHQDIEAFIKCKDDTSQITNFNISVGITDEFMRAFEANSKFPLRNPRNGEVKKHVDARELLQRIADSAWRTGEPGLFFIDVTNGTNPTPHIARFEATNPCGEQPLLPFESCNLGSIDLEKHLTKGTGGWELDWDRLERTVRLATRFLDNVIDMNRYPIKQIEEMTKKTRKIGLGVMGFARVLFKLRVPYDSEKGVEVARKIMKFIRDIGYDESQRLAESRGVYPAWEGSVHEKTGLRMRNSYVTTVAPTGTLSMIADTSGGCEPEFSLVWYKNVMDGEHLPYVLDYFIEVAKEEGWWSDDLLEKILENGGSCRDLSEVPRHWQEVFAVSFDVSPEWHVRMQAAFQEFCDAAVSKTINMPNEATVEDVMKAYLLAYKLGCKGITVYRDGSREQQVLNVGVSKPEKAGPKITDPRPRPDVIRGTTQKISTGYGALYVTINEDDHGLFEVFAQIGRGGGYTGSFTEAVARLISLCLRTGIPLDEIIDQLEGIRSPRLGWDHQEKIYSVPDALAKALKRHLSGYSQETLLPRVDSFQEDSAQLDDELEKEYRDDADLMVRKGLNPECPECGSPLIMEENCTKCRHCGFSEC